MKNFDKYIQKQLNDFCLEEYDLEGGWKRLERRMPYGNKLIMWWKYVAAACLLLTAFTLWLISNKPEKQLKIASEPVKVNVSANDSTMMPVNTVTIKSDAKASSGIVTSGLATKVTKHNTAITTSVTDVKQEKIADTQHINITISKIPTTSADSVIVKKRKSEKMTQLLPVITEDEFATAINFEINCAKKTPNRFTKYITERAQQIEYTTEKFSSSPTLIKF